MIVYRTSSYFNIFDCYRKKHKLAKLQSNKSPHNPIQSTGVYEVLVRLSVVLC